ncbi:polygalacturonase [Corynespora cassiicola Philippines]|uniref:galacturonan 1,4-alpha-galacturonidase n=1 Tax=Corynespora cassiicola Philippines TaxID=1448308 RepID=A0A2T2NZE8_CORCC|nr:polygalacturonase [Corynespora cassiicola Philippines]
MGSVASAWPYQTDPPSPPQLHPQGSTPFEFAQPSSKSSKGGKVCVVSSKEVDSGPSILQAAQQCNNGGTVYFPPGEVFHVATALDLTFLNNINFAILGHIVFRDDIEIWPGQAFDYPFQSASMFWRFGGSNVNIYGAGKGVIDGLGQTYWTAMKANPSVKRPTLFGTDGLHKATISGLTMKNPPGWFNLYTNSTNILVSDMVLDVVQNDTNFPAKNTDGFDTYRSSRIIVQNSIVVNTDDCVSFKPNTTDMLVQNLDCTGSHGISVGSLGQYQDEVDIVENLYIRNITLRNGSDAARIKVWPGVAPGTVDSEAGGGIGRVRNIKYESIRSLNNENAIALTQCYGVKDQALCDANPSKLIIDNIEFNGFSGIAAKKYDPRAGYLTCSSPTVCSDIRAYNINITVPSGKNTTYDCINIDRSSLELSCV